MSHRNNRLLQYVLGVMALVMLCVVALVTATLVVQLLPGQRFHNGLPRLLLQITIAGTMAIGLGAVICALAERSLRAYERQFLSRNSDSERRMRQEPAWLAPFVSGYARSMAESSKQVEELRAELLEHEVRERICRVERDELREVIQAMRDAVIVTDAFNELVLANDSAVRLFGLDPEESLNCPIEELIDDTELVRQIQAARESSNSAARRRIEHEIEGGDKSGVYEMSLGCLCDSKRQAAGVITILHDVTREREISQMKSNFVAQASHELRTPLSSIKAYVELLHDGEACDEQSRQEYCAVIQNETDRLDCLIDNMLNISKIEAGLIQADWQEIDLSEITREVVSFLTNQAERKHITLSSKDGQLCYRATADRNLIRQAMTNLVSNAIKYTPEGGRVTVEVDLADCNRSVMVAVNDTGLGIPPQAIPRLFEKFYRIESYKRVAKGAGLGLNLVKQIVEVVHKGEVGVESEVGMGSRFWFTVPTERNET